MIRMNDAGGHIVDPVVYTIPGRWSWTVFIQGEIHTNVIVCSVEAK